jgi:hypothetical protein
MLGRVSLFFEQEQRMKNSSAMKPKLKSAISDVLLARGILIFSIQLLIAPGLRFN